MAQQRPYPITLDERRLASVEKNNGAEGINPDAAVSRSKWAGNRSFSKEQR
jgi:hypothetical protein